MGPSPRSTTCPTRGRSASAWSRSQRGQREAILVPTADGVAGWFNHCQHVTHVPLDAGDGAPVHGDEPVCTNHGAMFEADTGRCTHGPCEGAVLESLDVVVVEGDVRLADPAYAFVEAGPVPTDDADRSSTSNVEF